MKISWTLSLHYGLAYMKEVIAACDPLVDEVIVLYSPNGSQGHRSNVPCPETEEELRSCFDSVAHKLIWHRGNYHTEGEHRGKGYELAAGSDLILQHDADEILDTEQWQRAIRQAYDGKAKHTEISGYLHYWRCHSYANVDPWTPMRIIKPSGEGKSVLQAIVHHMSYCMSPALVAYKLHEVSGHRREVRPRWFEDIFMKWPERRTDLHPVVIGNWWNAQPVDPASLPASLRTHPNFGKEVIA